MRNGVAILSGYNMRAIFAFLRAVVPTGIPVYIIASGNDDMIFLTSYKYLVAYTRKSDDINELSVITKHIIKKNNLEKLFILPSTEYLNRYLLSNREIFEQNDVIIPLVDKSIYELVSNKFSFYLLCIQNNLKVPAIISDISGMQFPVVMKSKVYNGKKPVFINSWKEYDNFIKFNDINSNSIQEYIEGKSFYLLFYVRQDGAYECCSQENLIQQNGGGSIIAAKPSDIHEDPIAELYGKLFKTIGFYGLVMVELRRNNGEYYMIEANPRIWGPSQLFVDCGAPLFEQICIDMGFEEYITLPQKPRNNNALYFWYGGLAESKGFEKYFNYSKDEFNSNKKDWIAYEIYNRFDTIKIFNNEHTFYSGII